MNLSKHWIREYLEVDELDGQTLAKDLTSLGLEVEHLTQMASGDKLTIGYVVEATAHPDSDHLNVCQVDTGEGVLRQIVCGAPNVGKNQKVIVALPGATLPGNIKIKESVIRGVESKGMICSLGELGYNLDLLSEASKAGIEVLNDDAPIGHTNPLAYLGIDDEILDISLTPNRADCLSMYALAYEVAIKNGLNLKTPKTDVLVTGGKRVTPVIKTDLCTTFNLRVIENVTIKESPQWLKRYLNAVGIKSINNIVDISNFVMMETGQPIHMYDYDKLQVKELSVEVGHQQEVMMLDGNMYQVLPSDLVICSNNEILGLAGVMGGESTKITDETKNIVVEVALFDPTTIRNTARRLNLLTEASQRFIKGTVVNSNSIHVLNRTSYLVHDLCKEAISSENKISGSIEERNHLINISLYKINSVLGMAFKVDEVIDIFNRLKFEYTQELGLFTVKVPEHRKDLELPEDLIEEIIRVHGYDDIPSTLPTFEMIQTGLKEHQVKIRQLRQTLKGYGLSESVNYSLVSELKAADFNLNSEETLKLMSPLSNDRSTMRQSLIPSLLENINYNQSRQNKNVSLYEISKAYTKENEKFLLSFAITGTIQELRFKGFKQSVDFYYIKGLVEGLLKRLGFDETRYFIKPITNQNYYHPGQGASIYIGKDYLGSFGKIHPLMAKKYEVKDAYIAELDLNLLITTKTKQIKYSPISQLPSVNRDLALIASTNISAEQIIQVIRQAGRPYIKEVEVFDIYDGEGIETGYKSIALSLKLIDEKQTLASETIELVINKVIKELNSKLNVNLRS